jgi:AraC family transcriptional regulator
LAVRSSERPEVIETSSVSEPSVAEVANLVPDGATFVTSAGRGWRGLLLAHADVPAVDLPDFTSEDPYVGVWLSGPASVEWWDGAKWRRMVAMPGSVGVVPAGEPRGLRVAADHEIAVVFLPRAITERELHEADVPARAAELVRGFGIPDPEIARIVSSLVSELRTGGGLGERLYVESLAALLAVRLLREHSSLAEASADKVALQPSPGLGQRQLESVIEFIEASLASRLPLSELAATAGLSPHHFARMFKRSTGVPPHKYVVRRRVERAKALLARSELPIAAVAAQCGFSHHQHLAASFARLVGTSPSRFRRASAEQELAPIAQGRGSRAARRTRESPASTAVEAAHPEGGGAC